MMELYAKSPEQGRLTLLEHTQHVLGVILVMARVYDFDLRLARIGAILHDLGKAHSFFQRTINGEVDEIERQQSDPHRHEISSLLFLPLFDKADWPILIQMVAAHHKSVSADVRKRGLVDLALERIGSDAVFERHAEGWEIWSVKVHPLLLHFGIQPRTVSLEEAREAFDFAVTYCDTRTVGWSRWRGLLMSADHFASEYMHEAQSLIDGFYARPKLDYYDRTSDLHPLSLISADNESRHTFVVAPTGAGKTDFLLRRCRGRVVYTLPFQASINAMFVRFDKDLNEKNGQRLSADEQTDIRRVHAASRIRIRTQDGKTVEEEQFRQRNPGASIKVTTPHQLAAIIFGTSGHEAAALDVSGCDVILDEVHVYDNLARAMTLELVKALVRLDCRVHIGTATIPDALAREIMKALGGQGSVYECKLDNKTLATFNRHEVRREANEAAARQVVIDAVRSEERVLFVANQVKLSQDRYLWAKEQFRDVPVLLVHSRFRRSDRASLEGQITLYDQRKGPCIVIATQIVEVSLDISFDRLVTDAAPLDSLVQRFGRIHRRRTSKTIDTYKPVHVISPAESDKDIRPYDPDVVRRSFAMLPNGLLQEADLQRLINTVYEKVAIPSIDVHLADGQTAPLRELCHRPKSALIDALEIEGAVCILESDREAYLKQYGAARLEMEIPVPWRSVARFAGIWHRLETGSYPFVVSDSLYNPGGILLGLQLPAETEQAAAGALSNSLNRFI